MHASELAALARPPVGDGGAQHRRARRRHNPTGRGLGRWGRGRGPARGASEGEGAPARRRARAALGRRAAGGGRLVFRDPLREGREAFHRLPGVVSREAALPAYQTVGPAAGGLAIEKLLHHRRPRRPVRAGRAEPRENGTA